MRREMRQTFLGKQAMDSDQQTYKPSWLISWWAPICIKKCCKEQTYNLARKTIWKVYAMYLFRKIQLRLLRNKTISIKAVQLSVNTSQGYSTSAGSRYILFHNRSIHCFFSFIKQTNKQPAQPQNTEGICTDTLIIIFLFCGFFWLIKVNLQLSCFHSFSNSWELLFHETY